MAVWSATMRKNYFPNPIPNEFYTGNNDKHRTLGHLEDYYAWEWGDALFIVLDPFWYTTNRRGNQWSKTLGEQQYHWLKQTLETSDSKFKFVFLHYLVGGLNNETRGGKSIAHLYEWGGWNQQGQYEWTQMRPGWEMPIHDLLKANGVSIVFHGHDHLFAEEYGYRDGVILSSSGHLRIGVSEEKVVVDYVYSFLPNEERGRLKNGQIAHSYTVTSANKVAE